MLVHVLQEHPRVARAQRLAVVLGVPAEPEPQVPRQQRYGVIGGNSDYLRVAQGFQIHRHQLAALATVVPRMFVPVCACSCFDSIPQRASMLTR